MQPAESAVVEVVKEIRFAVVLYGGVSLAIYINGVAQELLRMVRATTVDGDANNQTKFRFAENELDDGEKLYRDLAYLLADDKLFADKADEYFAWLHNRRQTANPLDAVKQNPHSKVVRFIADILSGSSAGGINGIYLAKALAAGQNLETLKKLWRVEGDFGKLLRDEQSVLDEGQSIGLGAPREPESLLNSERMYLKLLRAFDQMDEESQPAAPLVDETDLFVTTTDYWGVPIPIRLYDQLIYERRHRQMLHFRFRDGVVNDFDPKLYPFLAYAARCTSSFPLAFDPMRIKDANRIIERVKRAQLNNPQIAPLNHNPMQPADYDRFFSSAAAHNNQTAIDWEKRIFVDGGYLDNKPFGYAIEALAQKQSNVLVERKLIYVEPEPDADDGFDRQTRADKPGALANVMAALTDLPRYETIREDLQQVLQRNRLIVRVNQLVSNARRDELRSLNLSLNQVSQITAQYENLIAALPESKRADNQPIWQKLTLGELAQQKGQSVYSYYRLRVSALNDDLARMAARRAGLDENSDYYLAIRDVVRAWRTENYGAENFSSDANVAANQKTPLEFLTDYDYNYRLRRLRFVLQQADRLLTAEENLRGELNFTANFAGKMPDLKPNEIEAMQNRFQLVEGKTFAQSETSPSQTIIRAINDDKDRLDRIVRRFKREINQVLQKMQLRLWEVDPQSSLPNTAHNQLRQKLETQVGAVRDRIGVEGLESLLGKKSHAATDGNQLDSEYNLDSRLKQAAKIIKEKKLEPALDQLGETLRVIYSRAPEEEIGGAPESIFAVARAETRRIFNGVFADHLETQVAAYLQHFHDNFDAYDQIIFPVTYETPIGESSIVDAARISPLDARSLINELLEKKIAAELRRRRENPNSASSEPPEVLAQIEQAISDRQLPPDYIARTKVAGGVFKAFGAFFAEEWRQNDILWGRLDAAERLVAVVFGDGDDARRALRQELIEELHEVILANDDLMKTKIGAEQTQNSARPNVARIRDSKFTIINRHLDQSAVMQTASRSIAILRGVLNENELGSILKAKDAALGGLNLIVKKDTAPRDVIKFLKSYTQPYWTPGILFLILPTTLLGGVILTLLVLNSVISVFAAVIIAVLAIFLTMFLVYRYGKRKWNQMRSALIKIIYKNVTSVELPEDQSPI